MNRLLAGSLLLLLAAPDVWAAGSGPNTRVYNDKDFQPRQRYYCVIDPPKSVGTKRPSVCRAEPGRVGGRCRCDTVTGSGTLQIGG